MPGAHHGGWWYAPVVERLEALGHAATAVTLSDLDPDAPPGPPANFDAHVAELTALVREVLEPPLTHNVLAGGPDPIVTVLTDLAESLEPPGR